MTTPRVGRQYIGARNRMRLAASMTGSEPVADPDCLAAFKNEFDYLFRTMRRLGVPASEIEDLLQEVFLVVFARWGDYDKKRSLRAWLFGISFRVASNHRRKRAREQPHAWLELEDLSPQPEQALASKQARALVLRALQEVPLQRRSVLVLHDIDREPMREIAASLSIPLFTAYSRLRKARKEFEAAVKNFRAK